MDLKSRNDTFSWDWEEVEIEAREVDLNDVEFAIILIIWLIVEVFGNGMLIGIIVYEKEGNGDPLKRRITDQVRNYSSSNLNIPFYFCHYEMTIYIWWNVFFKQFTIFYTFKGFYFLPCFHIVDELD